jgi:Rod binding domain-containing protein
MTAPIDTSLIPSGIRAQGAKSEALYDSALQFEQLLVQQLAQGLTDSTQSDDTSSTDSGDDPGDTSDDGSSTSGGLGVYQGMLPDALAQSVSGAGGMGLALDLYKAMGGKDSTGTQATTGTQPAADSTTSTTASGTGLS